MTKPLKVQSLLFPILALVLAAIALAGTARVANAAEKEVEVFVTSDEDHGWLGITMQDIDEDLAKALDLADGAGVLVSSVLDDSPAEEAGLEEGDVIVAFAGKTIEDTGDLAKAVRKTAPGDEVEMSILRDGQAKTLTVTVGKQEPQVRILKGKGDGDVFLYGVPGKGISPLILREFASGDRGYLGVKLQDLNEQLGEYFGVADGEGVLISEVIEDSPAAEAGLKAGDVVIKLDDKPIADTPEIYEFMAERKKGDEVTVTVLREKRERNVTVTVGEAPDELAWLDVEHGDVFLPRWKQLDQLRDLHGTFPEIKEFHFRSDEELKELKEELEELRQELKDLKQEMKKG